MDACGVSLSVFHQVSNAVLWCCVKTILNEEKIFHLTDTEIEKVCYYKWRFDTNYCPVQGWKYFAHVYHTPNIRGHTKHRAQKWLCSNTIKRRNRKIIFSWRKINWHVLQILRLISGAQFGSRFLKKAYITSFTFLLKEFQNLLGRKLCHCFRAVVTYLLKKFFDIIWIGFM